MGPPDEPAELAVGDRAALYFKGGWAIARKLSPPGYW